MTVTSSVTVCSEISAPHGPAVAGAMAIVKGVDEEGDGNDTLKAKYPPCEKLVISDQSLASVDVVMIKSSTPPTWIGGFSMTMTASHVLPTVQSDDATCPWGASK